MKFFSWILAVLTITAAGRAQEAVVRLDPSQTRVEFTLADVLHTVHGTFQMKSGSIRIDPGGGSATGTVVVDTRSGDSGSHARDRRMHKDILESDTYAQMTFSASSVKGTVAPSGNSQLELSGTLTVHGAPHPMTLPVSVKVDGENLSAETHFTVPYVQWGMKNPSNFILRVSDKVEITIHAGGRIAVAGMGR
jgi:polyisoprenoid-binding protein YceI